MQDAVYAVLLLEASMQSTNSLVKDLDPLHTVFPRDPVGEYENQAERVLRGLQLNEIWEEERGRIELIKRGVVMSDQFPPALSRVVSDGGQ